MIRRPPRSTRVRSSAASDVYRDSNGSKGGNDQVTFDTECEAYFAKYLQHARYEPFWVKIKSIEPHRCMFSLANQR